MTVDFVRHTWQDWPSTETPITADELNRLEEGIAGLYSDLDGIDLENIEETVNDLEEAVENFQPGVELTQEEYDNLAEEEKNNGTVYYITDAPSTPAISALDASYNNSTSGLQATNVQGAVDEIQGEIDELNSNMQFSVYSTLSKNDTSRTEISAISGVVYVNPKLRMCFAEFEFTTSGLGGDFWLIDENSGKFPQPKRYMYGTVFCSTSGDTRFCQVQANHTGLVVAAIPGGYCRGYISYVY